MLTFAAARYSGNAINAPMYDMHIELKELPFLEGNLKTLGLLNYHPVTEIMAQPVVTVDEINRVGKIFEILTKTKHNGFPVISRTGHLRGLILRKHLCSLLKFKAFTPPGAKGSQNAAATVFHDTLERTYPRYPKMSEIDLHPEEMNHWLDLRAYMDTAVYSINESSSIQKCYRFFRTMGLRHLVVVDGDHLVTGMITRHDITEHRLEHHWFREGENLQRFINVSPMDSASMESSGLLLLDNDDQSDHGSNHGNAKSPAFAGYASSPAANKHSQQGTTTSDSVVPGGNIGTIGNITLSGPIQSTVAKPFANRNVDRSSSSTPAAGQGVSSPNPLVAPQSTSNAPQRNRDRATREPKSNKSLI